MVFGNTTVGDLGGIASIDVLSSYAFRLFFSLPYLFKDDMHIQLIIFFKHSSFPCIYTNI